MSLPVHGRQSAFQPWNFHPNSVGRFIRVASRCPTTNKTGVLFKHLAINSAIVMGYLLWNIHKDGRRLDKIMQKSKVHRIHEPLQQESKIKILHFCRINYT
jgi:hypothetical protein